MNRCKACNNRTDIVSYTYHDVYHCTACSSYTITRVEDCCRNPFTVVVKDERSPNLYFIRRQCINCGGCLDMTKPLSNKLYGDCVRGAFDIYRFNDWKSSIKDESRMLNNIKREFARLNSDYYKYLVYLLSDEWKAKRKLVFDRDNSLCQKCKDKPAVDVHHLTYSNLFNEPLKDLVAICKACHAKEHGKVWQ